MVASSPDLLLTATNPWEPCLFPPMGVWGGVNPKFRMSPNVAVRTAHPDEAIDFYTKVLGFRKRSQDAGMADLDADPWNLFVVDDPRVRGPVLELFVEDLEVARETLVAQGCKVLRWKGKGQDCYVEDPFGVIFNIWEKTVVPE